METDLPRTRHTHTRHTHTYTQTMSYHAINIFTILGVISSADTPDIPMQSIKRQRYQKKMKKKWSRRRKTTKPTHFGRRDTPIGRRHL